jgi:hypothetical protein
MVVVHPAADRGSQGFLNARFSCNRVSSVDMNAHTFFAILETIWSFAVKAWSGIGPLNGVLIGAWLTRSWQRKQWVLENKKAEYRELISTLSQGFHIITKNLPVGRSGSMSGEEKRESRNAWVAGIQVIQDRIFIDEEMRVEKIQKKWVEIARWGETKQLALRGIAGPLAPNRFLGGQSESS